jgi:hypothetical protein
MKKYEGEGQIPVITTEAEIARTVFLITGCTTFDYSGEADIDPGACGMVIVIGNEPEPLAEALKAKGVQVVDVPVRVEKIIERREDFRALIRKLAGIKEEKATTDENRIGLGEKERWMRELVMSDSSDRAIVVGVRIILFMNMHGKQRCNPSLKTIAKAVGRSKPTVVKAIKELVEKGWLDRKSGGIKRGGTSNNYRPTFPPRYPPDNTGYPIRTTRGSH